MDSLNAKIEFSDIVDELELIKLHNQRGILLFVIGEHEKAIDDFSYVLNNSVESSLQDESAYGLALWGRALGHAFLGKEQELLNDLNAISQFIGLYNDCNCRNSLEEIGCSYLCSDSYSRKFDLAVDCRNKSNKGVVYSRIANNDNNYEFCRTTVLNTISFMKEFIDNFPTYGTKRIIFSFIDGLGSEALDCCRGKGFWRNCVQPMVDQMNLWKTLGKIPSKLS